MAITVSLDVADKLEETMEHWEQYLNIATGEFASLSDCAYIEVDKALAEEIDNSDYYIRLPNQYDINEYSIMEDFAETVDDAQKRRKLSRALNGMKPYMHFKVELKYIGLDDAYYAFRYLEFIKIAKEWCEENGVEYIVREHPHGQN
ncbi:MAG: UPF0158 family protein [Clostridiales bacterium]|jgi:hypothetical protein|nr:UPF0158 family protein [Clostridiales bacterium]